MFISNYRKFPIFPFWTIDLAFTFKPLSVLACVAKISNPKIRQSVRKVKESKEKLEPIARVDVHEYGLIRSQFLLPLAYVACILQNPEHWILEINILSGWRLGKLEGGSWGEWINAFLDTDGSQWGRPADTSEHMYVLQKLLFH